MKWPNRSGIWHLLAVLAGIAGTAIFGPMIAFGLFVLIAILWSGSHFNDASVWIMLGLALAGGLGLIGFWTWLLTPPLASRQSSLWMIMAISCGILAVLPFVLVFPGLHGILALLGIITGMAVCGSLVKALLASRRATP